MVTRKNFLGALALLLTAAAVPATLGIARAEDAPALPAYFTGANADPAKPTWPDPTGAAAGVWATPAGDGKGDVPASLDAADLYDRIAHNLFSINMVWALITGFLVMFMQAGFMYRRDRTVPREERGAHVGDELHDLPARLSRRSGPTASPSAGATGATARSRPGWYSSLGPGTSVLNSGIGARRRADAAGNATGRLHVRPDRDQGLLPRRRRSTTSASWRSSSS